MGLNNERSRWIIQKNGLPQESVLSLTLFNIYTNDQPILDGTRSFIYTDDRCITAQYPTFQEVEQTIEEALWKLTHYYRSNSLGSKRHSLQAVELSQWSQAAVQIVSNLPAPSNGAPKKKFTVFWHAGHADPLDGWRCCSQKRVMSRPIQVRQL